jgi:2-C-methyl-D-erythritol 4-phosphate cytidylyltransferase
MSKVSAIVLAAGSGNRMNSRTKKQFMEIKGKPVIWYSLFAFEQSDVEEIILVTGKADVEYCREQIVKKYGFKKVRAIVAGGKERYESVYNGLKEVEGDIVLVHDGARPLINQNIIRHCICGAEQYSACVAGMPAKDTIKIIGKDKVIESTPDRNNVWITQTPQAFSYPLIKNAYDKLHKDKNKNVTDDAMVVEKYTNHKVRFVEGDYQNIKITTPDDLVLAEAFLGVENKM